MKNRSLLIISALIVVGILALFIGKGRFENDQTRGAAQSTSTTNNVAAINIGQQAPDFSLATLDGKAFKLSENKGKTVILFGMAGWCGTCIPEGRALTQIRKDYSAKGIEIIGVAFTKGDNDEFLKEYQKIGGINIPIALDSDNVAGKYQLTQLETTYIINKEGVIIYKDEQFTDYEDYKKEIDQVI